MNVADLILEKTELEGKMNELDSYLNNSDKNIPSDQRKIIVNQLAFMQAYKNCLEQRIELCGFAPADQCVHYFDPIKTNDAKKQDLEDDLNAGWYKV